MKTMHRFAVSAVAVAVLLGVGGCSGMSARDESTAIGAGIGAVGGAVCTLASIGRDRKKPATTAGLFHKHRHAPGT